MTPAPHAPLQLLTIFVLTTAFAGMLGGCAVYHAQPITPDAVDKALAIPTPDALTIQVAAIKHPILPPLTLDLSKGLTPDGAAVMAVILNPGLRAARDARSLASAQLLQAGILPNPQISYGRDFVTGGNKDGTFTASSLGLDWELTSVLTRGSKVASAREEAASVDMDIAWQEWQTAEAAKLATYELMGLEEQKEIAERIKIRATNILQRIESAATLHGVALTDLTTARAAARDAEAAYFSLDQQVTHQRLTLLRVIGLPASSSITLQHTAPLSEWEILGVEPPPEDELLSYLESRRLDLVALHHGYESEENNLRVAVLSQFPAIQLGFNQASDTSKVRTSGFGVSIALPLFDRNQGVIAEERATRQQLFDEYVNRVHEARSDVAMTLADLASLTKQMTILENSLSESKQALHNYQQGRETGLVDAPTLVAAEQEQDQRQLVLSQLRLQRLENKVALELAAGIYLPDSTGQTAEANATAARNGETP